MGKRYAVGMALGAALAYAVYDIWSRGDEQLVESHRRFRGAFADSPVGVALADDLGRFVEVNPALCLLLDRPPAELLGRSSREFTHPADRDAHGAAQQLLAQAPDGVARIEKRYVRPDGSVVWGWLTITSVAGPNGENWTLGHVQDITARMDLEQQLRDSQADLAAVTSVARCAQSGSDPRPVVLQAIRALSDAGVVVLFERTGDDLVATACEGTDVLGARLSLQATSATAHCYLSGGRVIVPDTAASSLVDPRLRRLTGAESALFAPVVNGGEVLAVLAVAWRYPVTSLTERAIRVVESLADETGAALAAGRLRTLLQLQAVTDPMTGVANRRGWTERVQRLTSPADRRGEPLAIVMADLDHFKAYNDTHGHEAGDRLLAQFATAAVHSLRPVDLVARWGGEEFAFALPGCDLAAAHQVLERLRASTPAGVTSSFGIAVWDGEERIERCQARADAALYRAKAAGRNRIAT